MRSEGLTLSTKQSCTPLGLEKTLERRTIGRCYLSRRCDGFREAILYSKEGLTLFESGLNIVRQLCSTATRTACATVHDSHAATVSTRDPV